MSCKAVKAVKLQLLENIQHQQYRSYSYQAYLAGRILFYHTYMNASIYFIEIHSYFKSVLIMDKIHQTSFAMDFKIIAETRQHRIEIMS